ncbi:MULTISPECIES: phage major capsid protein [Bradyrhizobium]|uniref:Phage major capsid protein n=1 Tax=Bradyrhizobium barranii subsp. barranii TaxID=2823807 RepID=A0A7Z0QKA0_9BRAD|nr:MULTISPECIES: phage major capsid protein [Bradyrhizobium]MCD9819781.1 phage major capsid protein [Bradyrhizobium japonicum]MEB2675175.1 phage major capsid protein [Bradyrhizobium japonicum]UEM17331.1 phage major capsid protein [Bradyrhizobium barranii subsp. barranii]UGX98246.1 phage major capsid protein [Bradyrhizobium barranii subsp. barranii]WLB25048.1 phage major capsid protein [Bradyrhizobium japonicum]
MSKRHHLFKSSVLSSAALSTLLASPKPAAVIGAVRNEAPNPGEVEKLLAQVKSELERISGDVKRTAEEALKQSKDNGTLSAELKQSADKAITMVGQLGDAQTKLTQKMEELETRNRDIEQKIADTLRQGQREQGKSAGEVIALHDDLKQYVTRGAKGSVVIGVNQAITSLSTSAGGLITVDRQTEIVALARRRMTVRALLSPGRTSSNMVEYAKQAARTNNAAVVTEGGTKPQSDYTWTKADVAVRTIAHWINVSRQALEDAQQLQTEIDSELRYGLDLAEEAELLSGSGAGEHLSGLITNSTAYSAPFVLTGATMIDQLRLAMLQASLAEFPADGMVLHPSDWARIELTKDGEDRYLWSNPRSLAGPSLWGLPVVDTQAMTVDKFLVGAFKMAATIYDRMDAEVAISSENQDNFIKNMYTVRAEKRLALAVKRPLALTYGDFGNV